MKPLVFLGSGVSRPTGLSDVDTLTAAIFEDRWVKHGDSNFYPAPTHQSQCRETQRCQKFLSRLVKRVAPYYQEQRGSPPNYEDLFFLVEQVQNDELAWDDNASIQPFREEIKRLSADLSRSPNGIDSKFWFQNLTAISLDFIQCVVWHQLLSTSRPIGFDLLRDLTASPGSEPLVICTVNHDVLVERALHEADIPYIDGFGKAENGIRFFNPANFRTSEGRAAIIKLHGSINWYRFRRDNGDFGDDAYGIPTGSHWHNRSVDGRRLTTLDAHPHFLTGSYNKIAQYGAGIFLTQMQEFDRALDTHSVIVMSGYGWGDKGINMRLKNWLWAKHGRRILLLYENLQSLGHSKALFFQFEKLLEKQMLVPIGKWLCDSKIADLAPYLSD
jgi:SIR2-like domain